MERRRVDDYEPGPIPRTKPLDRFGFVKELSNSPDGVTKIQSAYEYGREERRVRKWRKMIGIGGSDWKHYARRKTHVVKQRVRKGIPDCLRGLVWQLVSGSRDLLLMNPGVYEQLVIYETSSSESDIIRDISRTFPSQAFFQKRHGPGQRSLYNILMAYSEYDRDVGYVQVKLPFEKLIHALCYFPEDASNPDVLLRMAYSIEVTKHLEELKEEYDKKRNANKSDHQNLKKSWNSC